MESAKKLKIKNKMTEAIEIEVAKLSQKVEDLSARVERGFADIKVSAINRIEQLEKDKADRNDLEDLQNKVNKDIEKRVSVLESWRSVILGGFALIGVCASLIIYIYFTERNNIIDKLDTMQDQLTTHINSK